MKEINIGIIGYGFMGRTHTFGYKTIPLYYSDLPYKINLVGICDAHIEVANKAKETLGFEFATSNPEDIFNNEKIDIIDVCTPNIFHKEMVLKALKAGKHVYCDKPLATSYEETKEITDIIEQYDLITQMALQYRFYPATLRAKQLIEDGKLGKILSFRACYLHSGSVDPNKAIGWKQDKKLGGGGVLFDLGSHILDILYHLLGDYSDIMTMTDIIYPKRPDKSGKLVDITAEDAAYMMVKMKSGAKGIVEASKIATGVDDELRFEIHGDKGAIRFNLMQPNYLEFFDNTVKDEVYGGERGFTRIECVQRFEAPGNKFPGPKFSIGWIRGHVHSLFNFVDSVYNNRKAYPSFKEGAYIQYVMEKAYESDEKNTWIKL